MPKLLIQHILSKYKMYRGKLMILKTFALLPINKWLDVGRNEADCIPGLFSKVTFKGADDIGNWPFVF